MSKTWTAISKAYVFAWWEREAVPLGVLQVEADRVHRFAYAESWLARPDSFPVDPLRLPLTDQIYSAPVMFPVFLDSAPDAWGQKVHAALHRQAPANEIEWLIAGRGSGAGCLLFSGARDRVLPPLESAAWDRIQQLAIVIEEIDAGLDVEEQMVRMLLGGSSLGGARPKTSVRLEGREWLAKFGRPGDAFDEAKAEFATLRMARAAGLQVPDHRLEDVNGRSVVLVERFDRGQDGSRSHYISAHALLAIRRVNVATFAADFSYAGIGGAIKKVAAGAIEADLNELYRRMLFNVVIGNTDDHMRNHGFLYRQGEGFRLAPAFDLLPHPVQTAEHAIGIGKEGRRASLGNALSSAAKFGLSHEEAVAHLDVVLDVTKDAARYYAEAGMAPQEVKRLSRCCQRLLVK